MKYRLPYSLLFASGVLSCNVSQNNYAEPINKMQDTIFHLLPSVKRASIEVRSDMGTNLVIILGDQTLYNASDNARDSVASILSGITQKLFTGEQKPDKATLYFVKEEQSTDFDEKTAKKQTISLQ